jgi:aryl-alcohol dehydrogenase-like predicted oxidoreductase
MMYYRTEKQKGAFAMSDIDKSGTYQIGHRTVKRLGYGAMQLAGLGVFGPPKDYDAALAVLREAVANGVNHIDTSDFYGPHITNQLIREALQPYPDDLVIVTKVSARRGEDGSPNILLIPGTASVAHLRENLAASQLALSSETLAEHDTIATAATLAKH